MIFGVNSCCLCQLEDFLVLGCVRVERLSEDHDRDKASPYNKENVSYMLFSMLFLIKLFIKKNKKILVKK